MQSGSRSSMSRMWGVLAPVLALCAALAGVMTPAAVQAQGDTRLTGTVRDQSGAFVPEAVVLVKNERTGEERAAKTNADGIFAVTALKPSTYTVKASFGDFKPTEYTGMLLQVGQNLTLDIELAPAGVSEAVTVKAEAPSIDASSARMGVNVNQREVQELPLNGRQLSQLYLQAPGALNSGTGTFGDIRFSGRAVQQNMIELKFLHPRDSSETFEMAVAPQATGQQIITQLIKGDSDGPWLDPETRGRPYELVLSRTKKVIAPNQAIAAAGAVNNDYVAIIQPGQGAAS